jgi:hypothetical protein
MIAGAAILGRRPHVPDPLSLVRQPPTMRATVLLFPCASLGFAGRYPPSPPPGCSFPPPPTGCGCASEVTLGRPWSAGANGRARRRVQGVWP